MFEGGNSPKLRAALGEAVARLHAAGVPDASRDARILMRWATGLSAVALAAEADRALTHAEARAFAGAVAERVARRPVSQIIGGREFYGRWFKVTDAVLDPRPESETLVEAALDHLPVDRDATVLDLGVGSGCLLLSVLADRPRAVGLGVDASAEALEVAHANAHSLGLGDRARFALGDWLEGAPTPFDLILCNPPYIAAADIDALAPEVRLWEPRVALTPKEGAGRDPLIVYRHLAPKLRDALTPGGAAIFEIGRDQETEVVRFFREAGMQTRLRLDLGGVARVVIVTGPVAQTGHG